MSQTRKPWVDVSGTVNDLSNFFKQRSPDLTKFGSTVNQTFEAYLFASTVSHYRSKGWTTRIESPIDKTTGLPQFRLKFSTRGIPHNFSYAICEKGGRKVELRHQLKVSTAHHKTGQSYGASICLDLAVVREGVAGYLGNDDPADNGDLITFAEAKHMNAYAELVASFVGLVHEMQPTRLNPRKPRLYPDHESPFLFISGFLLKTARGILETIQRRKLDLAIYHLEDPLPGELRRRLAPAKIEAKSKPAKTPSPSKTSKSKKTVAKSASAPHGAKETKAAKMVRELMMQDFSDIPF